MSDESRQESEIQNVLAVLDEDEDVVTTTISLISSISTTIEPFKEKRYFAIGISSTER